MDSEIDRLLEELECLECESNDCDMDHTATEIVDKLIALGHTFVEAQT